MKYLYQEIYVILLLVCVKMSESSGGNGAAIPISKTN